MFWAPAGNGKSNVAARQNKNATKHNADKREKLRRSGPPELRCDIEGLGFTISKFMVRDSRDKSTSKPWKKSGLAGTMKPKDG